MKIAQTINNHEDAVSIHIRRGDYVTSKAGNAKHGTTELTYYYNAINRLRQEFPTSHLFFFSDDMNWTMGSFQDFINHATFVNIPEHNKTPWQDMHLMSLCRHHIIANSTFSWWGAWLGRQGGKTYAPKQWFKAMDKKHLDPCPATWERL